MLMDVMLNRISTLFTANFLLVFMTLTWNQVAGLEVNRQKDRKDPSIRYGSFTAKPFGEVIRLGGCKACSAWNSTRRLIRGTTLPFIISIQHRFNVECAIYR